MFQNEFSPRKMSKLLNNIDLENFSNERLTTPSKKYLPPVTKSPKTDRKRKSFMMKSDKKASSEINLEHPEKKYDKKEEELILMNSNNFSSRLSSIEKGIAHQLELYIERERDLEHRLKVTLEENKKYKQEVNRLWLKNSKLIDEIKDAKARALEFVQKIEQRYSIEKINRFDLNVETNINLLSEEEKRINDKINELNEILKHKENELKKLDLEYENKRKIQNDILEKERKEIQEIKIELERKKIVLEAKEKIMIKQDENYQFLSYSLQERENELEQIINERVEKERNEMKLKLESQLNLLSKSASSNSVSRENSFASLRSYSMLRLTDSIPKKRIVEQLSRLCFISRSAMFDDNDLHEVEKQSIKKNKKLGVTAIMLVDEKEGIILQTIEGPDKTIEQLFNSIAQDTRHFEVTCIRIENIKERMCKDSMVMYKIGNSISISAENVLEYINTQFRKQYQLMSRYIPPSIIDKIQNSNSPSDEISKTNTLNAVIFLLNIQISNPNANGDKILLQDQKKPFVFINKILYLAKEAIRENQGIFISYTSNMGLLAIFEETNTENSVDASIYFFKELKKLEMQYIEDNEPTDGFNPYSTKNVSVVITKGDIWLGNIGSGESMQFGPFGYPVSQAFLISQNMPKHSSFAFDSEITKKLSNPFFPKYSKNIIGNHFVTSEKPDGSGKYKAEISTLDFEEVKK